jgi:hypothetical protein
MGGLSLPLPPLRISRIIKKQPTLIATPIRPNPIPKMPMPLFEIPDTMPIIPHKPKPTINAKQINMPMTLKILSILSPPIV